MQHVNEQVNMDYEGMFDGKFEVDTLLKAAVMEFALAAEHRCWQACLGNDDGRYSHHYKNLAEGLADSMASH